MPVRVISGTAGGLLLRLPKGGGLRPTMDRVKSAIFSILGDRVQGASVLDLFAGTGSLGIEALSRGAASALFVDSDPRAVEMIGANLAHAGFGAPAARVTKSDALRFVRRHAGTGGPFQIIFADPPYAQKPGDPDPGLDLALDPALAALLAPDGLFILERRTGEDLPPLGALQILDSRAYGRTTVFFAAHAPR